MLGLLLGPISHTPVLCANLHHPLPTPFMLLKAPLTLMIPIRHTKDMAGAATAPIIVISKERHSLSCHRAPFGGW